MPASLKPHPLNAIALAEPCRARQVLHGCVVVDPADGRERLWLTNMNEDKGGELIAVDFERDRADVYPWPAGQGSWCVLPLPKERAAISTYYDGKFLLFDLRTKTFIHVIGFPGESYIWNMAVGSDGRVYGGTYSGAKLGCFDPETGAFEDCGTPVAGTGNLYLRSVMATPAGDVACAFGYASQSLQVYRVATREFVPLSPPDEGAKWSLMASLRGCLFVHHADRGILAFAGPDLAPVEPPLPPCPVDGGWTDIAAFSTEDRAYLRAGRQLWRWLTATDELSLAFDLDLRGGVIYDVAADGSLLGVRGQDYFVARHGDRDIALRRIPGEMRSRPFHFLTPDDRGRLWGGPPFGQTVCSYDLGSGEIANTGAVVDAGGEVYGAVAVGGKLYTASYSGADFAVYDPAEAWDQWNGKNPRHIASIGGSNQCRPTGRMRRGADGCLYSGWQAAYGRYGGALVRLDPRTDAVTVWEDPFGDEPVIALALDDRYAYLGTDQSANGLPRREGDGQFGVWDLGAAKPVFSRRMTGIGGVRAIGAMGSPRLALFPEGDRLHVFDADRLAFRDALPAPAPQPAGWGEDVLCARDGSLLFSRGRWLIRVSPDLVVEALGPLACDVHHMTFGSDGNLYVTSGPVLYRLDGVPVRG